MNLLHLLAQFDSVFLIDAVDFKGTPGEIKKFTIEEIKNQKIQFFLSTHEPDILTVFSFLKKLDKAPTQLLIFGVQPKDVSYRIGLSKEVHYVLPILQKKILKEIQSITEP